MMEENGLPKGWVETTLGEVSQFKYGKMPLKSKLNRGIYPTFSGYRYQYKYPEFNCKKGDVIVVARGVGGTGDVKIIKEQAYLTNLSILLILDEDVVSNEFLYFNYQHVNLRYLDSGSAQSQITINDLQTVTLTLPSLPEQKAIASILTSFDDKIELLQAQNETLENIAQTIFKEWFGKYQVGDELPEGWRVGKLSKIANFLNGLALQKYPSIKGEESLPVIKIRELKQGITSNTDRASKHLDPKYIVNDGDILFSWSGSLEVINWQNGKGALNQHLFKVTSVTYPKWFYYYWILQHLNEFREIASDKATTMGHINRKHLELADIIIPDSTTLKYLDKLFTPLMEKTESNSQHIQALQQTRDTLLPKLMSGQIRVNEFINKYELECSR